MQEMENDIELVTQDYMYSAAYQGTPLAKSMYGTSESLRYAEHFTHHHVLAYILHYV